ncbi:replication protein [Bacillus sp. FJAT-49736]|uniref:replication protein n=1 Tax=Bacillus sp. FJAT-49736 TaxID=2833582 RepID=UPI001BC90D50|nr:replication protein [Bacillus sp. FJAT-49736]MBS4172089.1 replication protein [Bacillus sp. FJAT-49736]
MANVQVENGYIRIATELMDEIIRRDFSKRQLAILHFIIRLSYGCQKKDCVIGKFNAFELAGLNKSDIKKELKFLRECRVINWDENTMIFSINKDYEKWQINPNKGFEKEKLDQLIHENIKKFVGKTPTNEGEKVGKIPTISKSEVGKIPTNLDEKVGKTPTNELVKHQLQETEIPWEGNVEEVPKDSIKDSYLKINTTTTAAVENPIQLFEKLLCRLSPMQMESLIKWEKAFKGKSEIVNEAITIADNKNKRYFGFVEFLLKEWANNNLDSLDRVRAFEQEKFNKTKPRSGYGRKPIRTEKVPDWYEKQKQQQTASKPPNQEQEESPEEKRARLLEIQKKYQNSGF